jgi:hypothetical protein
MTRDWETVESILLDLGILRASLTEKAGDTESMVLGLDLAISMTSGEIMINPETYGHETDVFLF